MAVETTWPTELDVNSLNATEVIGCAEHKLSRGDITEAIGLYDKWMQLNPNNSLMHVIAFNLGVLLNGNAKHYVAGVVFTKAIHASPTFLPARINLGIALESRGHPAAALLPWYEVLSHLEGVTAENLALKAATFKQIARLLSSYQLDDKAEEALYASLKLLPYQSEILHHWVNLRQRQCKWPPVLQINGLARKQVIAGLSPLSLAAYTDDPLLQLGTAAEYVRNEIGRPASSLESVSRHLLSRTSPDRLRIGYISSDLRAHAVGYLMAEVFELHSRTTVEVFTYYTGPSTRDNWLYRIKYASDSWIDISELNDEQAAQKISDDQIDILVDVNGHTNGARSGVVARRPAPVIVNWLGYPGSTGSPFHNYIIADEFIIPKDNEIYYSEQVKRLPCYQPNDLCRPINEKELCRLDFGLPLDGVVYCCFNAAHKVTQFTFRRWMEILRHVPRSVLWLLDISPSTNERLVAAARELGVEPDRIVFAPVVANVDHLARYDLADLFLDTSPYGAHTTASDALWAGLPVLTLSGRSFAARVCGSLVTAAGLSSLVCYNNDDYVSSAVKLGLDPNKLAQYREKLRHHRLRNTLFNTPRLVSGLEDLFQQMWSEAVHRRMQRPDLLNLDLYREIGAELDSDEVETISILDYHEKYITALSVRHDFDTIRADARLWSP